MKAGFVFHRTTSGNLGKSSFNSQNGAAALPSQACKQGFGEQIRSYAEAGNRSHTVLRASNFPA
jgi:hypothetical protein